MKTKTLSDLQYIDSGLLTIIKNVEEKSNSNFYLTSIKRSEEFNEKVGGWSKSQHVDWDNDGDSQAVDIRRSSFSGSPESIARLFYSEGATGVGIYDTHIHVDTNPTRVSNPYFSDRRKKKTKYDEKIGISGFDFFKKYYNQSLAEIRKGKNDLKNVTGVTIEDELNKINTTKFSNETLLSVGVAVIGILITLGILND